MATDLAAVKVFRTRQRQLGFAEGMIRWGGPGLECLAENVPGHGRAFCAAAGPDAEAGVEDQDWAIGKRI
jgi:hypothetical protein